MFLAQLQLSSFRESFTPCSRSISADSHVSYILKIMKWEGCLWTTSCVCQTEGGECKTGSGKLQACHYAHVGMCPSYTMHDQNLDEMMALKAEPFPFLPSAFSLKTCLSCKGRKATSLWILRKRGGNWKTGISARHLTGCEALSLGSQDLGEVHGERPIYLIAGFWGKPRPLCSDSAET